MSQPLGHWHLKFHANWGNSYTAVYYCPELRIYKQTDTVKPGYRATSIYFFEAGEDEPIWTDFREIRVEAEHRLACTQADETEEEAPCKS